MGYLEHVNVDLFLRIIYETGFDNIRDLLAFERAAEIFWSAIYMDDSWLPYSWDNGDIFPFPAALGGTKRRCGADGMYLEDSEEITGVRVVPWKRILEFASLRSCTRKVDHFKETQSESRQETTEINNELTVFAPAVVFSG